MLPNPSMNFTPFDTLPASDLNDIVENVEALADWSAFDDGSLPANLIDANAIGSGYLPIKQVTLGVAGDTITLDSLPNYQYLLIKAVLIPTGGTIEGFVRFNNDAGNNYARRYSDEGGADTTASSASGLYISSAIGSWAHFCEGEIMNVSSVEKLLTGHSVGVSTAGAGNLPRRREFAGKWANTSVVISRIDVLNLSGSGDFAVGSNVIIYGKN